MPRRRHAHAENGALRRCTAFLFKPKRIGNETRWLERCTWQEKCANGKWTPTKWIDKKGWFK